MSGQAERAERASPLGLGQPGFLPNIYDVIVFILIAGTFVALAHGAREMGASLKTLDLVPVTLDPFNLPEYALRTTLRMSAAILASLLFTFAVATLAAKNRKAELVIVPALDILQSVPILGFLTFTVLFFLRLFPGSELGAECAAIFAIFTSQAWNMAFSYYQSLRAIPRDLDELTRHFRMSPWLRFWRLELPFSAPGLIWNTMMSMSGGWFFVVASEAIAVGDTKINLPGIGSWLALAIERKDIVAVSYLPVGHFPRKAYEGAGIMAPVEAGKFKTFTVAMLRYYKENPAAYVDKCRAIQEAARKFDWQHSIGEWVELIESAKA